MDNNKYDVIIIGAGLTGLTAAINLKEKHLSVLILEAYDQVGGRVSTDNESGFILDRGFQVMLTEYPETKAYLNYKELDLKNFNAGAIILKDGKTHVVADPLRHPTKTLDTLFSSIGTVADKVAILNFRQVCRNKSIQEIFAQPEISSLEKLKNSGFSDDFINNFFRPFLGGIFLDNSLTTSSRMLEFVFKMFSEGYAAIPKTGMSTIPKNLAKQLPEHCIKNNTKVKNITKVNGITRVKLVNEEYFDAERVIIATDAEDLAMEYVSNIKSEGVSTTTAYFWSDVLPYKGPWLMLSADAGSLINHLAVMSEVSSAYAPEGKHLIAVNCLGIIGDNQQAMVRKIKDELKPYFGESVQDWHHIRTYKIRYALPNQRHVQHQQAHSNLKISQNLYHAGDYMLNGSISGAMRCGEIVAEAVAESFRL